jgi:hypothetical protein
MVHGIINHIKFSNKLDQLQLKAARIVTGLPIFASSVLIYKELGWESLAEIKKKEKITNVL